MARGGTGAEVRGPGAAGRQGTADGACVRGWPVTRACRGVAPACS